MVAFDALQAIMVIILGSVIWMAGSVMIDDIGGVYEEAFVNTSLASEQSYSMVNIAIQVWDKIIILIPIAAIIWGIITANNRRNMV